MREKTGHNGMKFDDEWFIGVCEILESHTLCEYCHEEITWKGKGSKPKYCNPAHARLYRAQQKISPYDITTNQLYVQLKS